MIPRVAPRGTSFKGAGLYYLHDKRLEGEEIRTTQERVAWTSTRNLATDDPDFALRIMAATAMNKDALKKAAGVRNTGNKSKGDVYAFSLAWHPDETGKHTKADMLQTADQALKVLGAHEHEAVIIAHKDEPQPHIHVIVNAVHPVTGKNFNMRNDLNRLIKWSNEYRKARGELHYCPNKAKKYEAIEARKRGENVDYVACPKSIPRHLYEQFSSARDAANKHDIADIERSERGKDQKLVLEGKEQAQKHRNEKDKLFSDYEIRRKGISKRYFEEKAAAHDAIKAQMKPSFKRLLREQWQEKRDFERREKRIMGKLQNMYQAVKFAKVVRGEDNPQLVTAIFNYFADAGNRQSLLKSKHDRQLKELRTLESSHKREATRQLNETRQTRMKSAREDFKNERDTVLERHRKEWTDLKQSWKNRTAERRKAAVRAEKSRSATKKPESLRKAAAEQSPKFEFGRKQGRKSGRTRSRSRKGR